MRIYAVPVGLTVKITQHYSTRYSTMATFTIVNMKMTLNLGILIIRFELDLTDEFHTVLALSLPV